jgi:UDP-GlcNAc:undecaprenyl-phosphate GlcNAc-1-phosphate transferase
MNRAYDATEHHHGGLYQPAMRAFIAAFVLAAVVAALLTPLVRRLALRIGAVSVPGGRHVHGQAIARLGGISIAFAFVTPILALFVVDSVVAESIRENARIAVGLMVGGAMTCLIGLVDDIRGVKAVQKLAVQIAAASLAFACGFRISAINLPLIGDFSMGVFAFPITVLWIVGVTNAVNLIDGLDGLAAGVVFFAAVTNFVVAYISGSPLVAVLMASMMGALIGFLFYNFNPARIFMGDSGSNFLGFVLASTSLAGASQKASTAVSLLVPIVALGVPIFDTLLSMVRRWLERRPIFSPDRGHVHHRLLDLGVTHRRAVLILYAISIVFTIAAIGISLGRSWQVGVALLAVTAVMFGLVRSLGYFEYLHVRNRQKARLYDRHTERLRRLIPKLLADFGVATREGDAWKALQRAMEQAEFGYCEVAERGAPEIAYRWSAEGNDSTERRRLVSAEFPVGRDDNARALIRFGWEPENEDVSAESHILLQLIVDSFENRLSNVGSKLAPASANEPSAATESTSALAERTS